LTGVRTLVTGGAGFLGHAFAVRARNAGLEVTTVDLGGDADFCCDVADVPALAAVMAKAKPEVVVHLAALLTDAAAGDPAAAVRVNVGGTAAVFAAARAAAVQRIVYASSVAAVGPCAEGSGDDVALRPQTVYGATKAAGEHLCRALSALDDYPASLALRFGWVYGPGRKRGWRVAQEMIERFARGDRRVVVPDFAEAIVWKCCCVRLRRRCRVSRRSMSSAIGARCATPSRTCSCGIPACKSRSKRSFCRPAAGRCATTVWRQPWVSRR